MPLPPFHLGPGFAAKAVAGRHFSFLMFGLTQVLIDLEPLYYMLNHEMPLHRFFHSYLGATVILAVALLFGKPLCEFWLRLWDRYSTPPPRGFHPPTSMSWIAAASGAAFGVYSHVLLDSVMHYEIMPFSPLSQSNPLFQSISMGELHFWCAVAGVFGIMTLFVVWVWDKWTLEV